MIHAPENVFTHEDAWAPPSPRPQPLATANDSLCCSLGFQIVKVSVWLPAACAQRSCTLGHVSIAFPSWLSSKYPAVRMGPLGPEHRRSDVGSPSRPGHRVSTCPAVGRGGLEKVTFPLGANTVLQEGALEFWCPVSHQTSTYSLIRVSSPGFLSDPVVIRNPLLSLTLLLGAASRGSPQAGS